MCNHLSDDTVSHGGTRVQLSRESQLPAARCLDVAWTSNIAMLVILCSGALM